MFYFTCIFLFSTNRPSTVVFDDLTLCWAIKQLKMQPIWNFILVLGTFQITFIYSFETEESFVVRWLLVHCYSINCDTKKGNATLCISFYSFYSNWLQFIRSRSHVLFRVTEFLLIESRFGALKCIWFCFIAHFTNSGRHYVVMMSVANAQLTTMTSGICKMSTIEIGWAHINF